jgi:hypothetical protein
MMVTTAQLCALRIASDPFLLAMREAWPELRGVDLILASLLRTWPLEWISLCTTVSSWLILFLNFKMGWIFLRISGIAVSSASSRSGGGHRLFHPEGNN